MLEFDSPLLPDDCKTPEMAALKIKNDNCENVYVFRNNIQIQRFRGSENSVRPNPKYFKPNKIDIWVHNHPGGSSFSPDDIQMTVFHNIKKIYLATPAFLYTLERKGAVWAFDPRSDVVNSFLEKCQERAGIMLDKLVLTNEISLFEKDVIFLHYIWIYFFNKYEAIYIQKEF